MRSEKYKCKHCKDKGYYEGHKIDGMTIYRWQKPEKFPCKHCTKGEFHAR